jgi:protein-tyrosine phosphatase
MEKDEISKEFVHCIIPIEDMEHVNIINHFENTFQFIQDSITSNQAVLVHCAAGVSRSVSIICAYLMKQKYINYEAAIAFIKSIELCAGYDIILNVFNTLVPTQDSSNN